MKNLMGEVSVLFSYPRNFIFLALRLLLAYGFSKPALLKLQDMQATSEWFASLLIPLPVFFAYLVTGLEAIGMVLLIIGLFTRFISVLLSFIMIGAMFYVHSAHGFTVADNGVEIPLYYMLFLVVLATYGAGKHSLDAFFFKDGHNE